MIGCGMSALLLAVLFLQVAVMAFYSVYFWRYESKFGSVVCGALAGLGVAFLYQVVAAGIF